MFMLNDFEDCLNYIVDNIQLDLDKFKANKKYEIQLHIFSYLIKYYNLRQKLNDNELLQIINCLYELFYDDIHKKLLKNEKLNQYYDEYLNDYYNSYNMVLIDDYCSYVDY
jgi:hypothetical protein